MLGEMGHAGRNGIYSEAYSQGPQTSWTRPVLPDTHWCISLVFNFLCTLLWQRLKGTGSDEASTVICTHSIENPQWTRFE